MYLTDDANKEIGNQKVAQKDEDDGEKVASNEPIVHKIISIGSPSIRL